MCFNLFRGVPLALPVSKYVVLDILGYSHEGFNHYSRMIGIRSGIIITIILEVHTRDLDWVVRYTHVD